MQDEDVYCYCNQVSYGEMVACDGEGCPREWFHLECVGLKVAPKGNGEFRTFYFSFLVLVAYFCLFVLVLSCLPSSPFHFAFFPSLPPPLYPTFLPPLGLPNLINVLTLSPLAKWYCDDCKKRLKIPERR